MESQQKGRRKVEPEGRWKWVLVGFLLVGGYFLWAEHKAHVIEWLPYALVLLCPLMHLFMHGGHGNHDHHGHHKAALRQNDAGDEK
ncbi:MAG TPA: DUF2933 domain-containing protein [Noviherbaspirillum sp.]|nr:DUF2933 domain-containing protein [Noviherbaspirillum sp.]